MTSPDARPVGETVAVLLGQIRAQVCCCEDAAECGPLEQISAARAEMDRLLDAYRDAVATEARAALLAGAPTVWVATDGPDGNGWPGSVTLFVSAPRWEEEWRAWCPPSDGVGTTLSRHLAVELGVPPGTCVRYRIVPDPEETP